MYGNNYRGGQPQQQRPAAGRGSHMLKPAWMTQGIGQTAAPSQPSNNNAGGYPAGAGQTSYPQAAQQAYVQHSYGAAPTAYQSRQGSSYPQQGYSSASYGGQPGGLRPSDQQPPLTLLPTVLPTPTTWIEAKTPEGRVYYSNTITSESTFDKPDELKTVAERQLPTTVWKEYCKDGRCYYVNSRTQQSTWEEPVEYTKFKLRLKSLCGGEAPTKDQASLAVYMAAKKAVEELVVDLDGSYAKMKAAQAAVEAAAAEAEAARRKQALNLAIISGELPPRNREFDGNSKEVFLKMLDDWNVPPTATWDEAFARGIAADPRFDVIKTKREKQDILTERRSAALKSANPQEGKPPVPAKAAFDLYLDELEKRGLLCSKSLFHMVSPIIRYEKQMPSNEADARHWFDYHMEQVAKREQREKEEQLLALESKVHDDIQRLIPNCEEMDKTKLYDTLMDQKFIESLDSPISPDQLRRFCGTYAHRMAERREALLKEAEHKARDILREGLKRAFASGALSTESRFSEFKADEDLRINRAPYLAEMLLPLAGNESAVEKEFRAAREDARDLISDVAKHMRDAGWTLPSASIKQVSDVTSDELKGQIKELEDKHGAQIVQKAFVEFVRRIEKGKERFFELLDRYVRDPADAVWEKIQPHISDRTAYKDMGSDEARKLALEEYVQNFGARRSDRRERGESSKGRRGRSRSRDRRGGSGHHHSDRHRRN